jgi:hypothetical protein
LFDSFPVSIREFSKGGGERKKFQGRSPVPLSGTIKEPHTDKFPNHTLLYSQSVEYSFYKNSQRGRGLKIPTRIRVPYLGVSMV